MVLFVSTPRLVCPYCTSQAPAWRAPRPPRAAGRRVSPSRRMEVTQEDLRRQCAAQNDAYVRCLSEGGADNCLTEKHELEQCAT